MSGYNPDYDLTYKVIKDSFGNLLQTGPQGEFYNGLGQPVNISGAFGPQGFQGFQGDQGPQGIEGTNGSQGDQGPQGIEGTNGSQGDQGPQGFQGDQGPQGIEGTNGSQGSQGDQGPQGNQGTNGSQGDQGPQGFQGLQGFQGDQGPQGFQGDQGPQGPGFQAITNVADNRILTSDGGTATANAEANLSFNGTTLSVTGNHTISGTLGVTGTATFDGDVNITSAATGTSVANLAIQSNGKIIKAGGNSIVDNFYYSVSNSVDTTFFEDDNVRLKWDETGNDLKFTMKVAPGGSGDMRSLGVLMGSTTTFNVAITTINVEYDLYSAGISAGNRMEAFVTAENDVTYPAYHVTAYNTGESFHNTIWVQRITKI